MSEHFEWLEPSETAVVEKDHRFKKKHDLPFDKVPVGKSFGVPAGSISYNTLRVTASRAGKKLGRVFRVIDHKAQGFEVYCKCLVADEPKEPELITEPFIEPMTQPVGIELAEPVNETTPKFW